MNLLLRPRSSSGVVVSVPVFIQPTDGQLMEKMVFKDYGRYYAPDHGREMFWDTDA